MAVFFTSDTHLGHGRILQYCNRPFADAQTQDSAIISRTNELVGPGDVLYHLGDIAWSSFDIRRGYLDRLVCRNVHLVIGNHDKRSPKEYTDLGFASAQYYKELKLDVIRGTPQAPGSSFPVILSHYPMRSWNHKGRGGFQLYGHCHNRLEPGWDRSQDVGVDTHDFYPWSWEEVKKNLLARPIFSDRKEVEN